MLRDPSWAFAYWDLSQEHLSAVTARQEPDLRLRVHETCDGEAAAARFFDIPVRSGERKWYINLPRSGRGYRAELILHSAGADKVLAASNEIDSPELTVEDLAKDEELDYISILSVAGIQDIDESILQGGVPQRIISLLDTQYLHLKG